MKTIKKKNKKILKNIMKTINKKNQDVKVVGVISM